MLRPCDWIAAISLWDGGGHQRISGVLALVALDGGDLENGAGIIIPIAGSRKVPYPAFFRSCDEEPSNISPFRLRQAEKTAGMFGPREQTTK